MYKGFERRPTVMEEALRKEAVTKQLTLEFCDEESDEERKSQHGLNSSRSSNRSGYRSALSPTKIVKTPHNIPARKFSNQFDDATNETKN